METPMNTEIVTAEGTRPSYADHMSTQLGGDIEWMGVKARDLTRDELLSLVYNMPMGRLHTKPTKRGRLSTKCGQA
jgi:hypothetical protein